MKKAIAVLLAVLLMVGVLVGCGGSGSTQAPAIKYATTEIPAKIAA